MGRRANYGFEKRQRELKKQKKKEAKAEKKRLAREAAAAAEFEGEGGDADEEGTDIFAGDTPEATVDPVSLEEDSAEHSRIAPD